MCGSPDHLRQEVLSCELLDTIKGSRLFCFYDLWPLSQDATGTGITSIRVFATFDPHFQQYCSINLKNWATKPGIHQYFLVTPVKRIINISLSKCWCASNRTQSWFYMFVGSQVAIKSIRKEKIKDEQDMVHIRREIEIMSSLRHPHIISIYEGRSFSHR